MKKTAFSFKVFLLSLPGIILAICLYSFADPVSAIPLPPEAVHRVESFPPIKSSDIYSRIYPIPDFVLKHFRELDGRDDYIPLDPGTEMSAAIRKGIDMLPPLNSSILKERLLGIFFIRNFMGYGMTEWAVDREGNIYSIIVINPAVFEGDISHVLTLKEKTCFIPADGYDLEYDCGHDLNGFTYIIIHESVHAVDYAIGLTPYTEEAIQTYRRGSALLPLMNKAWKSYSVLVKPFPYRDRVTFYGFSGGPKLSLADAPGVYQALEKSPLTSLYGSLNWAEDMADFVTFHHLARHMNLPVSVRILKKGKVAHRYDPMKHPRVKIREGEMTIFYNPARLSGSVLPSVPAGN